MGKIIASFLLLVMGSAFAQTCKLQWNTKQNCLDLNGLSGDRIVLPSNVTRLGQDGLTLCPIASEHSQIPAVVFIMDQSASMDSSFSGLPAGDPEHWRGDLVRNAIRYLGEISQYSGWFSYIEFAGDTVQDLQPPHADCIAHVNDGAETLIAQDFLALSNTNVALWSDRENSPAQNRCNTGTNYFAALDKAKRYISTFDPGDVNAEPSVIFVSDGRPNKSTNSTFLPLADDYVVPGEFPPVHGIFLGGSGSTDGEVLAEISTRTSGTYNMIDPNDTAAMNSVMNNIIDLVSRVSLPDSVVLVVNGKRYPSSRVQLSTGNFAITFPQDIPIQTGDNEFVMTVMYQDSTTGTLRNHETRFTLAVEGHPEDTGLVVIDSSFSAYCAIGNSLSIGSYLDPYLPSTANLPKTPWIDSAKINGTAIRLTAQGFSGSTTTIQAMSRVTGDTALLTLKGSNHILQGSVARLNTRTLDTLDFLWINPEDARDSIRGTILVYSLPSVQFSADTLFINQITSTVKDVAALGTRALVTYTWLDASFVEDHSLNQMSQGVYQGTKDLSDELSSQLFPRLVVTYTDALYDQSYRDTVELLFKAPTLPVAWLLDVNGDGQADQLELRFTAGVPVEQQMPHFQMTWGSHNQDTVYFDVDSLNPEFSSEVVEITHQNQLDLWVFSIDALPFGHTHGSGLQGSGTLLISGALEGRSFQQSVAVQDKVGPVLMDIWVDGEKPNVSYFIVSEPVESATIDNWLYVKHLNQLETRKQVESLLFDTSKGVYTMTLTPKSDNLILGRDSARLIPQKDGGIRDRNGNGAALLNPLALVRGTSPGSNQVMVAIREAMVKESKFLSLPTETYSETHFRTLLLDPIRNQYVLEENQQVMDPHFAKTLPTLSVSVQLPQISGYSSTGETLDPAQSLLAWENVLECKALFYDMQGQFITQRTSKVTLNEARFVNKEGNVNLALAWEPDPKIGLVSEEGRAIGTGPILVKVFITLLSTARQDLLVYDRNGTEDSRNSIVQGETLKHRKSFLAKFGYLRR